MELRPINIFGGRIIDDVQDADCTEIEFTPAWIDETDEKYGRLLSLDFAGYDDNGSVGTFLSQDQDKKKQELDAMLHQPFSLQALEAGEKKKKNEFYNTIYIAWWDGARDSGDRLPHPFAENIVVADDWSNYRNCHFSLRLNDRRTAAASIYRNLDTRKKTTFRFISDSLPDVLSVFIIHGKRYLCEKITATYSENGMSQLLKGDFYPIEDD